MNHPLKNDMVRQTLRMVVVLVSACVVFVGALSLVAVAVTTKVAGEAVTAPSEPEKSPAGPTHGTASPPKKPLSI